MKRFFLLSAILFQVFFCAAQTINYPDSSVLSSGNWYCVNIPSNNIYKLTYNDFISLGVDEQEINFDNLSIFSGCEGAISDTNSKYTKSDLTENAIYVNKQEQYVLFYAKSTMKYNFDMLNDNFYFTSHPYSDLSTYFITFDCSIGTKKRITERTQISTENAEESRFAKDFFLHKRELVNLLGSGRNWFGESFSITSNQNSFPLSLQGISSEHQAKITLCLANESSNPVRFTCKIAGNEIGQVNISSKHDDYAAQLSTKEFYTNISNESPTLILQFQGNSNVDKGRLDYILVNYTKKLRFNNTALKIYSNQETEANKKTCYIIENVRTNNIKIWDVTDQSNISSIQDFERAENNELRLIVPNDTLRTLYIFSSNAFPTPILKGKVENQNLHAWPPTEFIIVTAPEFKEQADSLAQLHREHDGITVNVATTTQVYNEFSSGTKDFLAIRELARMLYNKYSQEGKAPKNLLLFGDGTFDNKNILGLNNNYIPTYQSLNSIIDAGTSYTSDDPIGYLSPYSQGRINDTLKIGIGRITANNTNEANIILNKCRRYLLKEDLSEGMLGSWRNNITLTADDADTWGERYFIDNAETIYYEIKETNPILNVEKIYSDAYKQYSSSAGATYPDASKAINQRMKKGCLLFNYVGHGSEDHLSSERLITITDITSWDNYYSLPIVITSTCEFTRFDMTDKQSAGEFILSSENGGGIALISASRKIPSRNEINTNIHRFAVIKENNKGLTFGEMFMKAKNATALVVEERSFGLFGDPALRIDLPQYNIRTTKINDKDLSQNITDTIKALSQMTIEGEITDHANNIIHDFNGKVEITLLDKASNYYTLDNEGLDTDIEFEQQKNILHKGITQVENGKFTYTLTLPKDIAYNYGKGKLSYYAQTTTTDAAGYCDDFIIGGIDTTVIITETRPNIQLFINDTNFINGGITDENPKLFAIVSDEIAINTVGSGLGHDIMARLDNAANTFVLNDYFEVDSENPNKGTITFPFNNLSNGKHTLSLKVWNIFNFSSDAQITFVVNSLEGGEVMQLKNYPNPFTFNTQIILEHNQANFVEEATLLIFNQDGRLITQMDITPYIGTYSIGPITWEGTTEGDEKLSNGIYFCRMQLKTQNDKITTPTQKIVIFNRNK